MIYLFLFSTSALFGFVHLEDPHLFLRQLIDVNYHKTLDPSVLELFELEDSFFRKLSKDVCCLVRENTPSVVTEGDHPSNWLNAEGKIEQYSLLNTSGRLNDYSRDHNRSIRHKYFKLSAIYPALGAFIKLFPHAVNFRINILHPNSRFTQHQEDICFPHLKTGLPAVRVRFHLPIETNGQAQMLANGKTYRFESGKIYFFHNGAVHDGANNSSTDMRIHLLWDMLLTEDTFQRMFQRSIEMPCLQKIQEVEMAPEAIVGIDPDYKRTIYKLPYEEALKTSLCPIQ